MKLPIVVIVPFIVIPVFFFPKIIIVEVHPLTPAIASEAEKDNDALMDF